MRRFIHLSVKETRLYPGNAQCENIQCLTPIQMAMLHYEQCMAQRTTRHNLTSENKKSLPSMKDPPFLVFYFFCSDGIIVQFTVSLQQWKIISRSSSAFKSHGMVFRYNKAQKYVKKMKLLIVIFLKIAQSWCVVYLVTSFLNIILT